MQRWWKLSVGALGAVGTAVFVQSSFDTEDEVDRLGLVAGVAGIVVVALALAYAPTLYRGYGARRACKPSEWTPYLDTPVAGSNEAVHANTQAVHALCDRVQYALPDYVSATPAIFTGVAVASVVAYVGIELALKDKAEQERLEAQGQKVLDLSREFQNGTLTLENVRAQLGDAPFLQARVTDAQALTALVGNFADMSGQIVRKKWMLFLAGTLVASILVLDKVQERVYALLLLQRCKNRQHFAVAQFLKVYREALR